MEEKSRKGGGGCRSSGIRRKALVTGTKLEQALGRPLYLLGPVCLDQEVPAGEFYKKVEDCREPRCLD